MLSDRYLSVLSCPVCLSVTLVYCGQTVGRIEMKLGMQVGLGPGHIVLDGDPAPLPQRGTVPPIFGPYPLRPNGCIDQDSPIFGPCLLWPNGWMDQDGTWHGGRPQPRGLCVRCEPSPFVFPERGQSPLPNFRPMSIVVKQLNGSRWHLAWRWALVQAA